MNKDIALTKPKKKNKKHCPKCNSINVIPIAYGLPGDEMIEDVFKGKIHLGGCIIEENNPDFHCNDCEYEWEVLEGK